ncbi:MAG: virulence RhuM family protein [Peptococcaceae bacterium]|nr:virulence RhuM family protein [Peptococcaceae bacterium]
MREELFSDTLADISANRRSLQTRAFGYTKHINNIFTEGELDEKSNVQKMHIANSDKLVTFYNLDVIIAVGYRVKSQKGTQFRQWATAVLPTPSCLLWV